MTKRAMTGSEQVALAETVLDARIGAAAAYLTDLATDPRLRGIHWKHIERAALNLAGQGRILTDGVHAVRAF